MFCKNCGHEVDSNFKFCKECGTPVEMVAKASNVENLKNVSNITIFDVLLKAGKLPVIIVLVLQVLQLIMFNVPICVFGLWGGNEKVSAKSFYKLLYDLESLPLDVTPTIIVINVVAIVMTILLMFNIYKGSLIGNIIRFISWALGVMCIVDVVSGLNQIKGNLGSYFSKDAHSSITFGGVISILVSIALFVSLIILIKFIKQQKQK